MVSYFNYIHKLIIYRLKRHRPHHALTRTYIHTHLMTLQFIRNIFTISEKQNYENWTLEMCTPRRDACLMAGT